MSTATPAEAATTNVLGYFNGHKYPIHVQINRYNITLQLQPGEYVLDRKGRKINDPLFDGYKLLSRELSDQPVPVLRVPVPPPATPSADGQSVRTVTEFTNNARGVATPVVPDYKRVEASAVNNPSVRVLTMEEARQMRLVRPTRPVDEEAGVKDTDSALPPSVSSVPEIQYATDAPPKKSEAAPKSRTVLPKELLEVESGANAERRRQLQEAIVAGAAKAEELEDKADGFLNEVVPTAKAQEPIALPTPEVDPEPTTQPAEPAPTTKGRFICGADGRRFDYRSQLEQHVRRKYPKMVDELLKPYPLIKG